LISINYDEGIALRHSDRQKIDILKQKNILKTNNKYNRMDNIYAFRVIIKPDGKKAFHGYVPALPGCHTWGKTIEETKKNLKEAIKCHIQGMAKDGQTIPREENNLELVQTFTEKELALR